MISMKYTALIAAAGKGSRTGLSFNKVLLPINDKEVLLDKSLQLFEKDNDCEKIIVICAAHEEEDFKRRFGHYSKADFAIGGDTRQQSVYSGLKKVSSDAVMIHDGARPFVSQDQLDALKKALETEAGAILAAPAVDTIKEVDEQGYIVKTPPRSALMHAQTPQAFHTKAIVKAHQQARAAGFEATDDAQLMELFSTDKVLCIPSSMENKKITAPEDLKLFD